MDQYFFVEKLPTFSLLLHVTKCIDIRKLQEKAENNSAVSKPQCEKIT